MSTRPRSTKVSDTPQRELSTPKRTSTPKQSTFVEPGALPPTVAESATSAINSSFAVLLTVVSFLVALITFPFSLIFCIKVVQEYERAVIFRLGKLLSGPARGPGLFFILPCIDSYRSIDLRVMSYDVPPQEILSKDSVTVSVDAVVYFRVCDPIISVTNVNDAHYSTKLLTQTTLRNVLGTKTLAEMLSDREGIATQTQTVLDDGTDPWGIKVERVEVKDIRLPPQLTRAMAAEAEAAREARAKVIAAEGEQKASKSLKEASEILTQSSAALQLRYLQTLNSIAGEHNSTIIFPVPIQLFENFFGHNREPPVPPPPEGAMIHPRFDDAFSEPAHTPPRSETTPSINHVFDARTDMI